MGLLWWSPRGQTGAPLSMGPPHLPTPHARSATPPQLMASSKGQEDERDGGEEQPLLIGSVTPLAAGLNVSRPCAPVCDHPFFGKTFGHPVRRSELAALTMKHVQMRDSRWCIVDLVGKHGRVRTVPMPTWSKNAIDAWTTEAGVTEGHLFRPINRGDQIFGVRLSEKVVWQMLKSYVVAAGLPDIAPHDLRRTTAKLCRAAGGELEQIQMLLGHSSVQTTERYLGTKQDLAHAPNDAIKLKLAS